MSLNIVLDGDVILELLSVSKNDIQHTFIRLQKSPTRFWIPCCLLPLLETQIHTPHYQPLESLLEVAQLLTCAAHNWTKIPAKHSNKTQALISLDAAVLPGRSIIWTHNSDFASAHPSVECGDHEFIYGVLAEYEYDTQLPLVDLVSQQLALRPLIEEHMGNVLKQGQYILGVEVETLEKRLAAYVGVNHCIGVASGTDALLIALLAVGVKSGDEVITSPFSFIAAAEVIALLGAKPVFIDINPETYLLDPHLLEAAITPKTKAIIPINLFGQCADFDAINAIAQQQQIPVIEDAAQSFGATYKSRHACSLSVIGCTSFHPTKPLGAYGDGGACFTNNDSLAETMRHLRAHGQDKPYHHRTIGKNSRLDTLQASILLAKLSVFDKEIVQRVRFAQLYNHLLRGKVKTPVISPENHSVYAQYTIQVNNREVLRQKLQKKDIPTAVHYPLPIHLQPAFAYLGYEIGRFPIAEAVAQTVLSLPIHSYLTEEMVQQVAKGVISEAS